MKDYKKLKDEELCLIASEDKVARETLIERYLYLADKYKNGLKIKGADFSDIKQESRIAINKAIDTFNNKASFKTHAFTCVKNQINSFLRTTKTKKNYVLNNSEFFSELFEESEDKSDIVIDRLTANPEQSYIQKEDERIFFEKAKEVLSGMEYEIFILRYVENRSYEEIGKSINKGAKSIENALTRIKKKLKEIRS